MNIVPQITEILGLSPEQVKTVIKLLDEGATVPFIARYRKELTGSLDEVQIASIRDETEKIRELEKRRESILASIEKQELLTDELRKKIMGARTMTALEDLYLPFKPKRKTRATKAREAGLEPLAEMLWEQKAGGNPEKEASQFIDEEKGITTVEEALHGARDILAEKINEDAEARDKVRKLFARKAMITSRVLAGKEEDGKKFSDYFDWSEPLKDVPSHRMLAMRRGEKEMILALDIAPDEAEAVEILKDLFVHGSSASSAQVELAAKDAYQRLMKPSLETEMRLDSKNQADEQAITVFADNLRELLLAAPYGQHRMIALDPGFRTGCKVVVLDTQGKLLHHTAIFPNPPQSQTAASGVVIEKLIGEYQAEVLAVGNGTASRETEKFLQQLETGLPVLMVNESGASIYSASEVARDEFPDHDITVRGAVSIGRRLMDPLAELVKIDPKSIGVGQYQHDVNQAALKKSLDDVVMSCVNSVGVELNTASKELLSYVSGLGPQLAKNIVEHRNTHGAFRNREALRSVPRMGDKSFEQAAGFLRIKSSDNPLDNSAVHPESYHIVEKMARDLHSTVADLLTNSELRKKIVPQKYLNDNVGLPTLIDILQELDRPGRDPRAAFETFNFDNSVHEVSDLKVGMKLPGIVTNVTKFGAFVDIGVHQDGLVHISQLSDGFVSDPSDIVKVQQKVEVTVTEVDVDRKRISLSLKSDPFGKKKSGQKEKKQPRKQENMSDKLDQLRNKFGR